MMKTIQATLTQEELNIMINGMNLILSEREGLSPSARAAYHAVQNKIKGLQDKFEAQPNPSLNNLFLFKKIRGGNPTAQVIQLIGKIGTEDFQIHKTIYDAAQPTEKGFIPLKYAGTGEKFTIQIPQDMLNTLQGKAIVYCSPERESEFVKKLSQVLRKIAKDQIISYETDAQLLKNLLKEDTSISIKLS